MLEFVEGENRLEILSPMRVGARVILAALGTFPLIAPYELMFKIRWQTSTHPFFLLAAFISVGAIALSVTLFFAALAGLSSRMVFDRSRATFTYAALAPVVRERVSVFPLPDVEHIEVGRREWSDGVPSYHLRVVVTGGAVFEAASSWSREPAEQARQRIDAFLHAQQGPEPRI